MAPGNPKLHARVTAGQQRLQTSLVLNLNPEVVLDAFVNKDPKLARSVCERDDLVDGLNDQVFRELLTYMISDPKTTTRAVHLMIVCRCLERIADHATNIAEDVIFMVDALVIKHHADVKEKDA